MNSQPQRSNANFGFPSFKKKYSQYQCWNYWLLVKKSISYGVLFDLYILISVKNILVSASFPSNVWSWITTQGYYANQDNSFHSSENLMSKNTYFSIHNLVKSSFLFFMQKCSKLWSKRILWVPGFTTFFRSVYFLMDV